MSEYLKDNTALEQAYVNLPYVENINVDEYDHGDKEKILENIHEANDFNYREIKRQFVSSPVLRPLITPKVAKPKKKKIKHHSQTPSVKEAKEKKVKGLIGAV